MNDAELLKLAAFLVATLLGLLVTLIGWLGNKFYTKLDEISKNLQEMAGELHERINGLDRRVTRVETQFEDRRHG